MVRFREVRTWRVEEDGCPIVKCKVAIRSRAWLLVRVIRVIRVSRVVRVIRVVS